MRKAVAAAMLAATTTVAHAADKGNVCPEGAATLSGTIGLNRLFDPPEYWVDQSEPCRVHIIELAAPDEACVKGAKFKVSGTVEHVRSDGELSLVRLIKPEKMECTK